jgi:hypothetical protein
LRLDLVAAAARLPCADTRENITVNVRLRCSVRNRHDRGKRNDDGGDSKTHGEVDDFAEAS